MHFQMESQGVDHSPLGFTTTQIENWDDISETFDPALFDCFSQSANDATDVNESVNHERPAQSLGHANHPWSPLRQQNGCVRMVVLSPISVAHGSQSGDSGQSVIENTCVIAGENTTLEMANLTLNPVENASVSADASSPVLQTHSESVRYPMPLEPHITINRVATPTAVKHRRNLLKRERYCVRKTPLSPVLEEPEKPGDSNTGSANGKPHAVMSNDIRVCHNATQTDTQHQLDSASISAVTCVDTQQSLVTSPHTTSSHRKRKSSDEYQVSKRSPTLRNLNDPVYRHFVTRQIQMKNTIQILCDGVIAKASECSAKASEWAAKASECLTIVSQVRTRQSELEHAPVEPLSNDELLKLVVKLRKISNALAITEPHQPPTL
ncbi:uncharacterized protein [Eleutherodactylus coqui]|uniref:uncharacterized protein isoform X4 n=2 Tax=Eleutherodactylus coqui TaxID=57060 RepID=UPI003461EA26